MSRPTGWLSMFPFLIAGSLAAFVCARTFAAPQALAIEDCTNKTGDDTFDWLRFSLPQALAECVWQLPGVARGPATDCDPKPHTKFWVYRMTEAQKRLRAKPPPEWYRAGLHDAIAQGLAQQDPLDLPANPDVLVTGSIAKAGGALEVTLKVATASGETVREVGIATAAEKAVMAVPEEAAWTLRSLLTFIPAAGKPRPSLGTKSAEAARAYLEARFWLMSKAVEVLNMGVAPREVDTAKSGHPAAEDERDPGKSFETGREHAIGSLTRAISLDQTFVLPHILLGDLYLGSAVAAGAHAKSRAQIVFPPPDPTDVAAAGRTEAKSLAAARKEYETAVRLGDRSPYVLAALAAVLAMEAQAALSSGDVERGKALLDRSIQMWMDALRTGARHGAASARAPNVSTIAV